MSAQTRRQPDDDEVQYLGFQRVDVEKSEVHRTMLEEDGLVFCGFHNTQDYSGRSPPPHIKQTRAPVVIDLVSSDDEDSSELAVLTAAGSSSSSGARSTRTSKRLAVKVKNRQYSQGGPRSPAPSPSSRSTLGKRGRRSTFKESTIPTVNKQQRKDAMRQKTRRQRSRNQPAERSASPSTTVL
ncbi:uncharacterized protein B0H18DRAFT_1122983 [Fomitopsis serialis]|uniref:uncharacterized protein n=1 Tax=Fomitopsis serialis TaxID=139415 RepID=UPI0020087F36|nr:uncharacterized protein B0H18DRAFT_1122983 [Neoantrodia serialis]KAH9918471.1 hypothetical protein B0H18DRAFT_1122983 [Neoantrodia serialis]